MMIYRKIAFYMVGTIDEAIAKGKELTEKGE